MNKHIEERVNKVAAYMVKTEGTIRDTAKKFKISKSTVHKDLVVRLKRIDTKMYKKVECIIQRNKQERHIRGGMATKAKYEKLRKKIN